MMLCCVLFVGVGARYEGEGVREVVIFPIPAIYGGLPGAWGARDAERLFGIRFAANAVSRLLMGLLKLYGICAP